MKKEPGSPKDITRRNLLIRTGIVAGAAYVAPAMMGLNAAHASGASRSAPSRSAPSRSAPSRSAPSRSAPSAPSRASGPSRVSASGRIHQGGSSNNGQLPSWLLQLMRGW